MSPHRAASPSIVHGCIGGCAACSTSHPTTGIAANMLTRSSTPCIEHLILAPSKVREPEQMIPYTAQTCYRSAAAPSRKAALPNRRLQPLGHLTALKLLTILRNFSPTAQLLTIDCAPKLCPVMSHAPSLPIYAAR